jgi:hypothetical protein
MREGAVRPWKRGKNHKCRDLCEASENNVPGQQDRETVRPYSDWSDTP